MSDTDNTSPKSSPLAPLYIGRFAPSPSGKLHFGSLVSAVASYCDAKAHNGKWLVRIEDLDPPREEAGASICILSSLESHGLFWDDTALYQSQRLAAYQETFETLKDSIYPCNCMRQRILSLNGRYDGHCRHLSPPQNAAIAWRLNTSQHPHFLHLSEHFDDLFLGKKNLALDITGDFIVKRKDTLFSYQLAVVIDDLFQQVTHVIRGQDLLDSTCRQRYLFLLLSSHNVKLATNLPASSLPESCPSAFCLPKYGHTPLALGDDQHKLSKQTKARPIDEIHAGKNLIAALTFLGHKPPQEFLTVDIKGKLNVNSNLKYCTEILDWAIAHWDRNMVPKNSSVAPTLADA